MLLFKTKNLWNFRIFFSEITLTCSVRRCTTDPVAPPIWGSSSETIFWEMTQHYRDPAQGRSSNHGVDARVWRLSISLWKSQHLVWALVKSSHFYKHKGKRWKKTQMMLKEIIKRDAWHWENHKTRLEDLLWQENHHPSGWLAVMQQTDVAWRKISSKQLMQQSRKSQLIPFTATRCNMLREAECRPDVRRWVHTELNMQNKDLIPTEPRVTSSHCSYLQHLHLITTYILTVDMNPLASGGFLAFIIHLFT